MNKQRLKKLVILFSGIIGLTFSGCNGKAEKVSDSENKNPDTIILLDEGKEFSMAILDTKGKKIKEFEDISYADAISEGKIRIIQNGLYGAMDMEGNIIVEPKYEGAASNSALEGSLIYREKRAVFYKDEKYGYLDENGKEVIPAKFQRAGLFRNGLAVVEENDKWGYIDANGEYVIEPAYDDANSFFANITEVKQNDESLIINQKGEIKQRGISIPDLFRTEEWQQDGLIVVYNEEGKYGYMNVDGDLVVEPKFNEAYPFSDGVGLVNMAISKGSAESYYGYIGKDGNYVIEPKYFIARNFNDGYAYVNRSKEENIEGFIDKQGKMVTSKDIDSSCFEGIFNEGLSYVLDETDGEEYIQPNGECVISLKSIEEQIGDLAYRQKGFKDGYSHIHGGSKSCLIDKKGNVVFGPTDVPINTDYAGKTGLIISADDGDSGLMGVKNLDNEWVVEPDAYWDIIILNKNDEIPTYSY